MVPQNRRTPRGRQSERAGVRKKGGRGVDGGRGGDRWTSVQYRADRRPVDTLQVIVVCKTRVDRVVLQGEVEVDKVLQVGSGEDF